MKKLIALCILFSVTTGVWAMQSQKCPNVESIKLKGLTEVGETCDLTNYIATQFDKYDTDNSWWFVIGFFPKDKFKTGDEALAEGKRVLPTLNGNPEFQGDYCEYNISEGYTALAFLIPWNNYVYKNIRLK